MYCTHLRGKNQGFSQNLFGAQRKGRILPDLSVSAVPGRRFYYQLLRGLSLPQPQTGEHTAAQCFLPYWNWVLYCLRAAAFSLLPSRRGSGRSGLPVQCAVHSLCGAAGLAARHGQGFISRLLSAKPFLWLAQLSPYGFLIHQVLIRYMEWTADKFSLTVQPVVWTLTVFFAHALPELVL